MLRHALRQLRRAPGFSALVVACLALGIGVNVALFSIVDVLLLRPPARVHDAASLRRAIVTVPPTPEQRVSLGRSFARADLVALERALGAPGAPVARVAGARRATVGALGRGRDARPVQVAAVTGGWFPTLGVCAALGRTLQPADDRADAPAVAVLSDALWRRAFGADPHVVGRRVRLAAGDAEVVGVIEPGFAGIEVEAVELWVPHARSDVIGTSPDDLARDPEWFHPVLRLRAGADDRGLAARMAAVLAERDRATATTRAPMESPRRLVTVEPLAGRRNRLMEGDGGVDVPVWLLGATAAVLLVSCANVVNLLLARGERRRLELATRAAIGASRARLGGQLLAESALLATLGGAAGLGLAALLVRLFALLPNAPAVHGAMDARSAAAACALALVATVAAGVVPALAGARTAAGEALKQATPRAVGARGWLRGALVVTQLAATLVLLAASGLFVRSLRTMQEAPVGYPLPRLASVGAWFQGEPPPLAEVDAMRARALAAVRRVPGVEGASAVFYAPLQGIMMASGRVPGRDVDTGAPSGTVFAMIVDAAFLRTMAIPLVRGRGFTPADERPGAPKVALVSARFARAAWPGEDALGRCLEVGSRATPTCATVVGIVSNVRALGVERDDPPMAYFPLGQSSGRREGVRLVVRTASAPGSVLPALRRAVQGADDRLPLVKSEPLIGGMVAQQLAPYRLAAWAFGVFGALALVVAAVGLYSVMAYAVARRTGEIGVRMALGARTSDVRRLVLGGAGRLACAGALVGVPAALAVSWALRARLHGVEPWDPATLLAVTAGLVSVALLAAWLPARRAARVDPASALRAE